MIHPVLSKHKLVVGVTGASGAIYASLLFRKLTLLKDQIESCGLIFSPYARSVWDHELENRDYENLPWRIYEPGDFYAPMASGSAGYRTMIVCPCTMGTLGRIAAGTAGDLMTRAADVILKERGTLILVVREMPYNLIHIRNMQTTTRAGAIILPASPSFYSKPPDREELLMTVVDKALLMAGFSLPHHRWQEIPEED